MRFFAAAAVVAAAVAVVLVPHRVGAADASGGTTLRYTMKFSPFTLVDLAPKGYSRGDQIVSNDLLLREGRQEGYDSLACTLTTLTPLQSECSVTFVFGRSTITAQYANTPPPRKELAITGGTGRYANAHGTAVILESATSRGGTAEFRLRP